MSATNLRHSPFGRRLQLFDQLCTIRLAGWMRTAGTTNTATHITVPTMLELSMACAISASGAA